ncbi:P-loop containing nucleoside triphosphate hydrolase protein [Hymenopellis radicata]|nr:P-loop containing nucleoside triphosphate hydrolase protein [Hymenopellis radicata]
MSVETLIPRRYQEEIFVKAQTSNVIAALDTGSGKTFISTLLIKWIAVQPSSYSKSVVFLVPKVALAEQQADFITRNTSFRVLKIYGSMDVDVSDREGWESKFAQHDVIVTTPQVFYNLITHSVWKISKVSLLVFDECHHTRKNHPYNMIMREYQIAPELDLEWEVIERRYQVTLFNLGPFCAAMYLHKEMWTRIRALIVQRSNYDEVVSGTSKALPDDIYHVAEILLDYQSFFTPDHHSPTFQGIVFVEQRQVAACLADILPNVPELKGLITCADLVGKASSVEGISNARGNSNAVLAFRQKKVNLLIATNVAEEGLDFPACDLVIRFDKVQHLVGYVQSRGRARNKASTFIIMVQSDDTEYLKKFNSLSSSEPALKTLYQTRAETLKQKETVEPIDDEDDDIDDADLQARARYVVPGTGAFLTYDNAVNLIGYLCALIPVDKYTSPQLPEYTDHHSSVLRLPACLPLPPEDLVFKGPLRHSKKEAKRAVAFMAVKRLHQLDVLDDYLLPVANKRGKGTRDLEGRRLMPLSAVPVIMDVIVRDPWTMGEALWLHVVYVDDHPVGGLVTGTDLPPVAVRSHDYLAETRASMRLDLDDRERSVMDRFTRLAIWHINTAKDINSPLSLFLVPITDQHDPDFPAMERLLSNPYGDPDWSLVTEESCDRCMIVNINERGRPYLLRRIRRDLSPQSPLPADSKISFATYYEYWKDRWTRDKWTPLIPTDGPLIEVSRLHRLNAAKYHLDKSPSERPTSYAPILLPLGSCGWLAMSWDVLRAYQVLPHLTRRLTDIFRARAARFELGIPPAMDDLLVQALTIPGAGASYSNQRLETLGDAVLKLCTTVHLFNKYPYRHEGQLDIMRQNCVSNRFLMTRALEIGLQRFISGETHSVLAWRYVVDDGAVRCARRDVPRRSLQDCMEATLGAVFATGGIPMALRAGVALGLSMGGPESWRSGMGADRAGRWRRCFGISNVILGTSFAMGGCWRKRLPIRLLPRLKRPCRTSGSSSSETVAVLDIVVLEHLYKKFPTASSAQLHLPKSRVVCASALAFLAVKHLGLHKLALINNVDLSMAIDQAIPVLESLTPKDILTHGWKYHPPKALSDFFESIMGAVLVDSGYDYERTAAVVECVMACLLDEVSPSLKQDPVTELHHWVAKAGCRMKPNFSSHPKGARIGVAVSLHDVHLVGPIASAFKPTAKFAAAERALALLKDPTKATSLEHICVCGKLEDELATLLNVDYPSIDTPIQSTFLHDVDTVHK